MHTYLPLQQLRRPQPHHPIQQHPLPSIKPQLPTPSPPTIQRKKELSDLILRADDLLQLPALELQLIRQIRGAGPDELFKRHVSRGRGHEGHADCEDVRDEIRVPEGDAVDEGGAPVVSAEDDLRGAQAECEGFDVVCAVLVAVWCWGVGCVLGGFSLDCMFVYITHTDIQLCIYNISVKE